MKSLRPGQRFPVGVTILRQAHSAPLAADLTMWQPAPELPSVEETAQPRAMTTDGPMALTIRLNPHAGERLNIR